MNYVYIRSEPGLWTVGFYDPYGKWNSESDHNDTKTAANRCAFLNGGLSMPQQHLDKLFKDYQAKKAIHEKRVSHNDTSFQSEVEWDQYLKAKIRYEAVNEVLKIIGFN